MFNVSKNVNIYKLNRTTQKGCEAVYILGITDRFINNYWQSKIM